MLAEDIGYGSRRIIWWTFRGRDEGEDVDTDPRDARELLEDLLQKHTPDDPEKRSLRQSLAGIIGAAFGGARREGETDAGLLYTRFRSRFAKQRELPESMLDDPGFERWLRKRANELSAKA